MNNKIMRFKAYPISYNPNPDVYIRLYLIKIKFPGIFHTYDYLRGDEGQPEIFTPTELDNLKTKYSNCKFKIQKLK